MSVGAFYYTPRLIGTIFNFCYGCCHLSAFVTGLSYRMNPYGKFCAVNIAPVNYEGDYRWSDGMTYQSDGNLMLTLCSIQAVLWTAQCCCYCIPLLKTPVFKKEKTARIHGAEMDVDSSFSESAERRGPNPDSFPNRDMSG